MFDLWVGTVVGNSVSGVVVDSIATPLLCTRR